MLWIKLAISAVILILALAFASGVIYLAYIAPWALMLIVAVGTIGFVYFVIFDAVNEWFRMRDN